jgi:hypothetical protein
MEIRNHKDFVRELNKCESFSEILDVVIHLTHTVRYQEYKGKDGRVSQVPREGLYVRRKVVKDVNKCHPILKSFINIKKITNELYGDFIDEDYLEETVNMFWLESMFDVLMGKRNHKVGENLQTDGTISGAVELLSDLSRVDELCRYAYTEAKMKVLGKIKQNKNNPNYEYNSKKGTYTRRQYAFLDDDSDEALDNKEGVEFEMLQAEEGRKPLGYNQYPAVDYIMEKYIPRLNQKQQEFVDAYLTYGLYVGDVKAGEKLGLVAGAIYDNDNNLLYSKQNVKGYMTRIKDALLLMFEMEGDVTFIPNRGLKGLVLVQEVKGMYKDRYLQAEDYDEKINIIMDFLEEIGAETLFDIDIEDLEYMSTYDIIDFIDEHEDEILKMLD